MSSKSIPEPWRAFLSEVDATANQEIELHCLGGFVIKILYGLKRPTADVDVITNSQPLLEPFVSRSTAALH